MLTINATNFGVSPDTIQIKEFHTANMLVLNGEFAVDTTAEAYAGIRPMQLTVADLPFEKSKTGTVLVTAESEGVRYATLAKVWVSDRNTINIGKITPYKSIGSYKVKFSTLLIPEKITGEVALNTRSTYNPVVTKGEATGLEVITVEHPGWMMLVLKAATLAFDETDGEVQMTLPVFPEDVASSFPVMYNEGLWVNLGSKYYPASIRSGILTISKDGAADEAANTGCKFTRIIIVR